MIKITDAAAAQILASADQQQDGSMLRIAARRMPDGGIDHTMGFDSSSPKDTLLTANDIDVVISQDSKILTQGLILDFVEYEAGDFRFIFNNPNDASKSSADADDQT